MLPKSLLVIAATALSFGYVTRTTATLNISDRYRNSVLALGPPFRIVIDNLLDPNDKNYWYLAPDARRVYGTTKAGVYNFATDTPSGQIFTGGKAIGASPSETPLYPILKPVTGSGVTTTFSVSSTGQLIWKNPSFTQAPGQTAQFIQWPKNDFEYHELRAYLGPNNYGDAKLYVQWI